MSNQGIVLHLFIVVSDRKKPYLQHLEVFIIDSMDITKIEITQEEFNSSREELLKMGDITDFFKLSKQDTDKSTTIYGLYRKKDDSLFYIGKSTGINKRAGQHRYNATVHKRDSALYQYIREIIDEGDEFEARAIIKIPVKYWGFFEAMFINSYKADGCDLKNTIVGGIGSEDISPEDKGAIKKVVKKVKETEFHTMKHYHKNPRHISKKQADQLKENLVELGDLSGIVHDINSDEIISGNQRSDAIEINKCKVELVHKYNKPTKTGTVAEGYVIYNKERYAYRQVKWTPKQCERANITANKLGGEFDMSLLSNGDWNFEDLLQYGFNTDELAEAFDIKNVKRKIADDEVPEVEVHITKPGDVWVLGDHRLVCGSATEAKDIEKLMDGKKADMVFTDPPYNVNYSGQGVKTSNKIENDHMTPEKFDVFLRETFVSYKDCTKQNTPFYVCHSSSSQIAFEQSMNSVNLEVKNQIIWNKLVASMGWGDYRWKHEPIFYATFNKKKVPFYGDRTEYTVWDETWDPEKFKAEIMKIAKKQQKGGGTVWTLGRDSNYQHPTQKPIELIEIALENSSKVDQLVLDLFGRSGSTLIGCEKINRVCYMMELTPKYCDVIVNRFCEYSDDHKVLLNGKKFVWGKDTRK